MFIATYNMDKSADNPLLNELRKRTAGKTTVVTNVPNRRLAWARESGAGEDKDVNRYMDFLDASKFTCALESWFCFENHAKLIICDDLAYVGSANLSWGSKKNFEAGYLVDDPADLDELRDFAERILAKSVPYLNIQGHRDQLILLKFAASVEAYRDAIEESSCDWVSNGAGDADWEPAPNRLSIPAAIAEHIVRANFAAARLHRRANGHPPPAPLHGLVAAVAQCLDELDLLVRRINDGEAIPAELHEEQLSQELVEKYLHTLSNNGSVTEVMAHSVFQDDLQSLLAQNRDRRDSAAALSYESLRELLGAAPNRISDLLRAIEPNPQLQKIRKKFE